MERLDERKLKKHGGNMRKSLTEAAGEDVRQSLAARLGGRFRGPGHVAAACLQRAERLKLISTWSRYGIDQ
jgi:hypothetical protein